MIERLGAAIIDRITRLGNFVIFLFTAVLYVVLPPYKPRLLLRQIRTIGAESLFLVGLIGLFTGMVLGLQGYNTLRRFGSEGALGTVVALVLVRELGPVLAALMITARAGSAMAAEIGAMQATEQVDALTVMAINPVQYLVSPRVLAGVNVGLLLQRLLRGSDGHRGQSRDDRRGRALECDDPRVGLFYDLYSPVEDERAWLKRIKTETRRRRRSS